MPHPVKGALREDFVHDACFGMPGVPQGPGSCELSEDGKTFRNPYTEFAYQIWLRGAKHAFLEVRDRLKELGDPDNKRNEYGVDTLQTRWLLLALQDEDLLPKRPGD